MTLQEAKDLVAESHHYDNWYDLQSKVPPAECYWHLEQVAELYARSKWDEACEETRSKAYWLWRENYDEGYRIKVMDKPEFKP